MNVTVTRSWTVRDDTEIFSVSGEEQTETEKVTTDRVTIRMGDRALAIPAEEWWSIVRSTLLHGSQTGDR